MTARKPLASAALAALLLAACSSAPAPTPAPSPVKPAPAPAPVPPAPPPKPAAVKPAPQPLPAHLDPRSAISTKRSFYFDLDQYVIKPEFASLVELHGKYLAASPALSIRIEGNADERGSAEYNLALGQKRAEAVRRALKAYGVKDVQMEAVSFGKEKPVAAGHDESSWAQNRRADLRYPGR